MVVPSAEGDITLNDVVLLRNDLDLAVASTNSGTYWAWVEDFNFMPPVEMSTNDVPKVYTSGMNVGGDVALTRRYAFDVWGAWEADAGLVAMMTDLATASQPLATTTATLKVMLGGVVWTATGRYEPVSLTRTDLMIPHKVAAWSVRFRATDPVLASGSGDLL